jgi:hypothetical protein
MIIISGGGCFPLTPGFQRYALVIRGYTPSWVQPGTVCSKLHTSVGRTREQ